MFAIAELWGYRIAAVAWMAVLSGLSSQPGTRIHVEPPIDKIVHLCAFGVLGYLVALGSGPRCRWHASWIAVVVVAFFGAADEYHQAFSPGRSMSFDDWLCDTAGGAAAGLAWLLAWSQGLRSKPGKRD